MEFGNVNYLTVLVGGLAGFITGAVWYTILGKAWMKAAGLTEEDTKQSAFLFINAAICQLVMAWMLTGLIKHLIPDQVSLSGAWITALSVWFGFILTTQLVNHRFQGKPFSLSLIDCGHWLAVLLVQATVIGLMGV